MIDGTEADFGQKLEEVRAICGISEIGEPADIAAFVSMRSCGCVIWENLRLSQIK